MPQFLVLEFPRLLLALKVKDLLREICCINFRESLRVVFVGKSSRRRSFPAETREKNMLLNRAATVCIHPLLKDVINSS